ncbi:sulfatase-like hydrolase/transferase [Halorussus caseinilyticus]|uniref:sulfatase-like hydrolase/transferase n=1 Tax=Halorussus caseinilyticus TaxID=3034025 RepID=UPI0023E83C99|nr:sulfatase-like hydrolase/transferase [Halorussus sp. DT72]
MTDTTLLVTVDSLRYDHYQYMTATREFLGESHPATFATNTATPSCFQSIVGGIYPGEVGVDEDSNVGVAIDSPYKYGVSTNRFLSNRYGYDLGFDHFSAPSREDKGLKAKVAEHMTPQSTLFGIASRVWNVVQGVQQRVSSVDREYRPAADVIAEFLDATEGRDEWFGWLHFMEPHHPYNPDDGPVSRGEAQQITRRVLNGRASERDERLARELYKGEVEELDDRLARLWETIPDETRVLFVADHGELLGEFGEWGHHATMCPELLRLPLATRNIPIESEVLSLVDVPTLLLGEEYNHGSFERETAYAASNGNHAAMNRDHVATDEGVVTLDGDPAEDDDLMAAKEEYESRAERPVTKDELPHDDLEALGYL